MRWPRRQVLVNASVHARQSRRYQAALQRHLKRGRPGTLRLAKGLGRLAMTLGVETLDLARIHEEALITLVLPSCPSNTRDTMVRRAGAFFAQAIIPIEETHRIAQETNSHLSKLTVLLGIFFLIILLTLTMVDYVSRGFLTMPPTLQ